MRTMKTTPIVVIRRAPREGLAEAGSTDEANPLSPLTRGTTGSPSLNCRAGKSRV